MACKGICIRYKADRPTKGGKRYSIGQKRCQTCDIFIKGDGFWCPCCGYRLRSSPRKKEQKKKKKNIKI